ncbi:DUF3054 domain-containing protein [Paenarthrobacter nitroguajacolicus]|uniref:DUF3054 domain-containing protein n=1 Tax=Paenarthrobacter nitroguajacolicus TaxID=211146 RepID=UPI00248C6E73|nr:DUF3054 domain-containing protein [Paenarthrobacter nitroguajacolicus]MDI2032922.1 hypothetical protein [Paenarthrobacter nitroguajacolicus]
MPSPSKSWIAAAAGDLVLILVFAAIGRDAHARGDIISGAFITAWPFLAGALVGWIALRVWRAPFSLWPSGVAVWLSAVIVGMLLRAATGQGVALPFIIVALISLGVFLLGFRAVIALVRRISARRQHQG